MPQNPTIIATKPPTKNVMIYDYTKHASDGTSDGRPQAVLTGHSEEGCASPSIFLSFLSRLFALAVYLYIRLPVVLRVCLHVCVCRFGLSWNRVQQGLLLSSSSDRTVCEWDLGQATKLGSELQAIAVFRGHTDVVGVRLCASFLS